MRHIKRDFLKKMEYSIVGNSQINLKEEERIYKRFLKLPKKLAYGKDTSKAKKIVDPLFALSDYCDFDTYQMKLDLSSDFSVFKEHCNFSIESLDSEKKYKQVRMD